VTTRTSTPPTPGRQEKIPAFRAVRWLVGAYVALSMLTVAAIITLSDIVPDQVTPQAWVRGIIVAATSALTLIFANRAAKGSQRALLRLRIAVSVILIALGAVLVFVPLPLWMIIEQAACGALLFATAIIIFGQGRRSTDRNTLTSEQERSAAS
jgi:hypothetical protein